MAATEEEEERGRNDNAGPSSSSSQSTSSQSPNTNNNNEYDQQHSKSDDDEAAAADTDDEAAKIEKAVQFWNHPSLQTVSSTEKRAFLHERGLTDDLIHKAWDKMVLLQQQQQQQQQQAGGGGGNAASLSRTSKSITNTAASPVNHNSMPNPQLAPPGPSAAVPPYTQQQTPYMQQQPSHQQQQYPPYNTTYPSPSPVVDENDDDENVLSVAKGLSLIAVGGMLGVTAAAAVRWLNGGDFELFPPSTAATTTTTGAAAATMRFQEQDGAELLEEENDDKDEDEEGEYYDEGEEYYNSEDYDEEEEGPLASKMEQLFQAVTANTETQEKLMRRMANSTSTITNHSMDLLRSSSTPQKEMTNMVFDRKSLLSQLTEIKDELTNLLESLREENKQELEIKSAKILEKLEGSMEQLNVASVSILDNSTPSTTMTSSETNSSHHQISPSTPVVARPAIHAQGIVTDTPTPITTISKSLQDCIRQIVVGNDAATLKVGTQLLYLYLVNLSGKPDNPRYRKIYTSNSSFPKVESLAGGRELLHVVGFESNEGKKVLEWIPSGLAEEEAAALVLVKEAAVALGVLKSGVPSEELTERALSKLRAAVATEDATLLPLQNNIDAGPESADAVPPPPPAFSMDLAPQTPAGSMLVSPPATKKLPFPEGTPTNLSDLLEQSTLPTIDGSGDAES